MREAIAFFVRYKVWNNVLLLGILLFGFLSFLSLNYAFFPETPPTQVMIQVAYPGASPEEVEEGVILKIEENVDGIDGIERVTSVSRENSGTITVEAEKDADLDKVLADVKNAVDRISSFPLGIEKPVVFEQKFRRFALSIVIYGSTDLSNLKFIAENIRDELLASDEISQVEIQGLPKLEISISVSEENMRRYGLRFTDLSDAVRNANINISGGKFETRDEEILIRAYGRNYRAAEFRNIPLRENADGTFLRLSDVAQVREQWEDIPDRTFYNERTAIVLNVDKTEREDILAVVERAKQVVDDFNAGHEQVQAMVIDDQSIPLLQRIEMLVENGIAGLVIVILTLGFFMNMRLSLWVSVGIPFSFAGMFIVAGMVGLTINVISLFGMIIVIGILVDDAIVVGENIYAHYERGKPALQSAIDGTLEMIGPVTTAVLTTVLVFVPFFFLDGFLGQFIWHMAVVVIATLLFSLVEAFFILPGHLAHSKGLHPHAEDNKVRRFFERIIDVLTHKFYASALRLALRYKLVTVAIPLVLAVLTAGLMAGGVIGFTFFPNIDGDSMPINVSMVSGRQEEDMNRLLQRIEEVSWQVNEQLKKERADGQDVIIGIRRELGSNDFGESGSHTGKLTLYLLEGEARDMESQDIANRIRAEAGPIHEARNITYGRVGFFGKPVAVSLLSSNLKQLNKAAELLQGELESFTTLKDVTESNQEGRRELDIRLKPLAHSLGLSLNDVAGQVRQGFFGQEVQRIQRGRDEIRVWVRYNEEDRSSIGFLDRMRIRTPAGEEYPFGELAEYSIGRGITVINHLERMREIKVEANLAEINADLPPILQEIREEVLPRVLAQTPGVRASFEGQSRNQEKTNRSMGRTFPLAFMLTFILIILVFRSFVQAAQVMMLIPFGLIGALWGHGIIGIQVNTLSIYGILALSGIIINDSIVFIDQINRNLRNGAKVYDAVYEAGISRLRPIILTTFTTAFGLAPIIAETSRQAQFLIPMAVSVAFGLMFGTFLLLLVLPAVYLMVNWLRYGFFRYVLGRDVSREEVEPAVRELRHAGQFRTPAGVEVS